MVGALRLQVGWTYGRISTSSPVDEGEEPERGKSPAR